jgi:hypothetical protein
MGQKLAIGAIFVKQPSESTIPSKFEVPQLSHDLCGSAFFDHLINHDLP